MIVPRLNGVTMNGTGSHRAGSAFRSPSPSKQVALAPGQSKKIRRDSTFPESPAIIRSPTAMSHFWQMDQELDMCHSFPPGGDDGGMVQGLKERLIEYAVYPEDELNGVVSPAENGLWTVDGDVGMKRKL